MTEISLQIWWNNSSGCFLSNPLAICLQKFAGEVQKKWHPPQLSLLSCTSLDPATQHRDAGPEQLTGSCGACSGALSLCDKASGLEGLPGRPSQQHAARQPHSSGSALHHHCSSSHPLQQHCCPGTPAALLPALARGICFLPAAYTHSSP